MGAYFSVEELEMEVEEMRCRIKDIEILLNKVDLFQHVQQENIEHLGDLIQNFGDDIDQLKSR